MAKKIAFTEAEQPEINRTRQVAAKDFKSAAANDETTEAPKTEAGAAGEGLRLTARRTSDEVSVHPCLRQGRREVDVGATC